MARPSFRFMSQVVGKCTCCGAEDVQTDRDDQCEQCAQGSFRYNAGAMDSLAWAIESHLHEGMSIEGVQWAMYAALSGYKSKRQYEVDDNQASKVCICGGGGR